MYEWAGKGIDPYLLQVFLSSIKSENLFPLYHIDVRVNDCPHNNRKSQLMLSRTLRLTYRRTVDLSRSASDLVKITLFR